MSDPFASLQPNAIVRGPLFGEPVQILATIPLGRTIKLIGKGLHTGRLHEPILSLEQVALLDIAPDDAFDGDAGRFRLGVEALRLGLAHEYDPFFALSIARVDPLPHQLEAVYDYFLRQPRIRFLLADDPGAGKTIMAGLLLKELKSRGLVQRVLIVTPANLTFQWQRELQDKFRESFEVVRGDVLRASYGSNPWQDKDQVITSLSWVSRVGDARESLRRSQWDLVIVDEAHKMSASRADKKTLAYQLGEALSEQTDHYLLMTATPHKGDLTHFCLFLRLLDRDVYADVASLEEAMRRQEAPFYLRRVKEALVTFPDPVTGEVRALFTQRHVRTIDFAIDDEEWDFYNALTHYVEEQSIRAAQDDSARGRALGFTMALLQRRFASSLCAVRRSLERMKAKREKILANPASYQPERLGGALPDDFDELTDIEQQELLDALEGIVASADPHALRVEVAHLGRLIQQAQELQTREVESKLARLRDLLHAQGLFDDPTLKLLLFTEHRDTLEYLVGKLVGWGLTVTQIHGGMRVGDRDSPGTRLHAERAFRDSCQILVATEAAGEGINLQFCWLLVNYDIPWNPVRLEQRMGRIHRYGQEKDCLIFNFVATNTSEGRVLHKLFERVEQIERDLDPQRTGKVFNVLGDLFPANQLERLVREMYARNRTEESIKARIVAEVDRARFERITHSTLEGLAKRELNLATLVGRTEEARERRLVPEVIEEFFVQAAPVLGLPVRETRPGSHLYRVERLPRSLVARGEQQEGRFGKLGQSYRQIAFDKARLTDDPTLEWVTPGHPLWEAVRAEVWEVVQGDLQRGACFYDLHRTEPSRLDLFSAAIRDGRGHVLHRRLFVVETMPDGALHLRQPTLFLDLTPAASGAAVPAGLALPGRTEVERMLVEEALAPFLAEISHARGRELTTIERHARTSLDALIDRQQQRWADLWAAQQAGSEQPLLAANLKQAEDRLDELNARRERRLMEIAQERQCSISEVQRHGGAWVLPHPERDSPALAPMVRDDEIERIAVQAAIAFEEARGWQVESVESENRGFDLLSRPREADDPARAQAVRFIEVKGRAKVGEVALSANEYRTAARLRDDYWLYVVFDCATAPQVRPIQDPARLDWEPIVTVEHYRIKPAAVLASETPTQGEE